MKNDPTPLPLGALLLALTLQVAVCALGDGIRARTQLRCMKAALSLCQDARHPSPLDSNSSVSPSPSVDPLLQHGNDFGATRGRRKRHCQEWKDGGDEGRGMREIFPYKCCPDWGVHVFCDQDTDGGGWTVFQRRMEIVPQQDFYRTWVEYQQGFGNMTEEFWLGLDLLHELTTFGLQELRVDLGDCEGNTRYARYGFFHVADSTDKYRMQCGRCSGDAVDSLSYHSGQQFSTHDNDNDQAGDTNCASDYPGAWWYKNCHDSNLNGKFLGGKHDQAGKGIVWHSWKSNTYSLCHSEMKIRPSSWETEANE